MSFGTLFLLTLAGLAAVFYLVYRDSVETSRRELFGLKTKAIAVTIDDALSRALQEADEFFLRYPVTRLLDDPRDTETRLLLFSKTSDFLLGNERLSALTVADPRGDVLLHVGSDDAPGIAELVRSAGGAESPPRSRLLAWQDVIYLARRIPAEPGAGAGGHLLFRFDMRRMRETIRAKYTAEKVEGSQLLVRLDQRPVMVFRDRDDGPLDAAQIEELIAAHRAFYNHAGAGTMEPADRVQRFGSYYVFDHHSTLLDIETYYLIHADTYWHGADRLINLMIAVLAVGMLLAVDIIMLIAGRITGPLRRLTQATREIGRIDGPKLAEEDGPGDEVGELRRSFVALQRRLESLISRDYLTGMYNRQHFMAMLERELSHAQRAGGKVSCMIVDVDHFKGVNDTHGHAAGDAVLQQVARTIGDGVRGYDVAARIGGEEFAVLLPGTAIELAVVLAERIRATVETARFPLSGRELAVTVSIGVCDYACPPRDERPDGDALLQCADRLLYDAKRAGRNRVVAGSVGADAVLPALSPADPVY